jgi:protein translocase SecG subunit
MNKNILSLTQIVISVLLMGAIILQQRDAGLSSAFGGFSEFYATRRGFEKGIFVATVILAALLLASVILDLRLS